jgi:hydrogenase-4 component E
MSLPLSEQAILLFAGMVLFTSFSLLAQPRIVAAIRMFAWQGVLLSIVTVMVAVDTGLHHLYISALLTLLMKAIFIPWLLHRLVHKMEFQREQDILHHPVLVLLAGGILVIFCYSIALPIERLGNSVTQPIIALSMAMVMLAMLMLITRHKAVSQVIAFMAMENGLFFAAISATHGMPMVVELGIAFDVFVAAIIFGVFFFHIKDSFDSLDVDHLSSLSESDQ